MPSKYDKIIKDRKLARHLGTEPKQQEVINAIKQDLAKGNPIKGKFPDFGFDALDSPFKLADAYVLVRTLKETEEAKLKGIQTILTSIIQLMVDSYEASGISMIDLTNDGKVRIYPEPYLVVQEDDVFRKWCINENLGDSLKMPWMKANSIAKERLVEGLDAPDGTEAKFRDRITWKRS